MSVPLSILLGALALAAVGAEGVSQPGASSSNTPPLIAHWTFDEAAGNVCADASGHGHTAALEPADPSGHPRGAGVFGKAFPLGSRHFLRVPEILVPDQARGLSLSAWVRPLRFDRYNEIFRKEDGDDRLLFSFQETGTVLSLGLNIGGYVECDAPMDPARVLDGQWHHCAASFDGQWMRVYLDGREIGRLERPGVIRTRGAAPNCIGSLGGHSEFLQGSLDDLRIHAGALSAEQIAGLHRSGAAAVAQATAALEREVATVFPAGPEAQRFSEALARCRQNLAARREASGSELPGGVAARLRRSFPEESAHFTEWTGASLADYLLASGNEFHFQQAARLVELMLEYQPLTPEQRSRQSEDDRRQWGEAEQVRSTFERLRDQGDAARFSPAWVTVIMDAGRRVQFRPQVSEAVAPYQHPETPPTRSLSAAEARGALERDWLHQAGGTPTFARVRQEIEWTRQLARRLAQASPSTASAETRRPPDFSAELAHLDALAQQAAAPTHTVQTLYFQVRELKRAIQFRNPALDFEQVLFVDMPFPRGSEWEHETRHRLGYMAVPGARLLVLEGLSPAGRLRQLAPQTPLHGSFWRPEVSFDATKALFCFKPHNEKSFHLYEIRLDGAGLRQLTDGPFDDLDPVYLPDGHILFSTTRAHTYVRCMPPTSAFVLARCEPDGRDIYLLSQNNEPDYLPSVMADGRVIYTRWEYTDKALWRDQKLWTMNPDGTQVNVFWGSQSVWPDVVKDARNIPGSRRVMFTGSAHHNWFSGAIGIIDPDRGLNFPDGLTKVTAELPWPETGNGPVDPKESPHYHPSGSCAAYYSPYPLSEHDFLVSANRNGRFVLYLMDVDGNRELIYEGAHQILHALPIRPRTPPPLIADRVAWPERADRAQPRDGVIFSHNVYQDAPAELRGKARYLRVLHIEPKTYTYWNKRPYISTGPVVSMVQSEGVKRVLGTVPLEPDGSVAFHAPPGLALHFQLLDERYRALQTMRSFVGVMPGEYRGCQGCHESHSRAPASEGNALALRSPPRAITPPPWGADTVSYPRYVQPVLDRYCGPCHQGQGEARQKLDLTFRPGEAWVSEPYVTLIGRPSWGRRYVPPANPPPGFGIAGMLMVEGYDTTDPAAYRTVAPMTALSYRSPLIEIAGSGQHHDVKVDALNLQRLIAWVDAMCPYSGDEEIRSEPDPVFQGVEWLSVRPRLHSAPRPVRPGPVD